ncbi:MAG: tetratricopeptide repeat protein [Ignavibacteria bacterium]
MKSKSVIYFLMLFLIGGISSSYADDFSDAILKAKKDFKSANDKSDQDGMIKARGEFERILQLKKNQWLVDYYLADVDFALSYISMQSNDKDNIKKYTESSLQLLDKSTDMKDDFAEAYILKMAVNGNRWMYEPDKMNDILAKTNEATDKAKKLEPDNPRFYVISGMNLYYTPETFGGGASAAQPLFEKAYELFQNRKEKDDTYPSWGYDLSAGMLAMCYIKQDKLDDAKKYIDKGLEIDPESGFILNVVKKDYDDKIKK